MDVEIDCDYRVELLLSGRTKGTAESLSSSCVKPRAETQTRRSTQAKHCISIKPRPFYEYGNKQQRQFRPRVSALLKCFKGSFKARVSQMTDGQARLLT